MRGLTNKIPNSKFVGRASVAVRVRCDSLMIPSTACRDGAHKY